ASREAANEIASGPIISKSSTQRVKQKPRSRKRRDVSNVFCCEMGVFLEGGPWSQRGVGLLLVGAGLFGPPDQAVLAIISRYGASVAGARVLRPLPAPLGFNEPF